MTTLRALGRASLLALALLAAGCATKIGDFPVITTVAPDYAAMASAPTVKDVSADNSRLWFLCFPLGGTPTLGDAVAACLQKGNGDFMTDGRAYAEYWSVLVFSYGSYRVTGNVGNSKAAPKP